MCLYFKFSEAEHGYASTLPMPDDYNAKKRSKSKKSQGNRYDGRHVTSVFWFIIFWLKHEISGILGFTK